MSWRKALGLSMGMLGIMIIMGFDKLSSFDLTSLGQLAMIGACLFYGSSGIYIQKFVPAHLDKTVVTTYTLIWAAIAMSVVSIFVGISLLNESLKPQDIIGVMLIFLGVAIIRNFDALLNKLFNAKSAKI